MTATDALSMWQQVSAPLRTEVSEASWLTSFQEIQPLEFDGQVLTVAVDNWLLKERFEQRHLERVQEQLRVLTATPHALVRVEVRDQMPGLGAIDPRDIELSPPDLSPLTHDHTGANGNMPGHVVGLEDRYTFEDFVIGPSNRFAQAAALAVSEAPARSYNPLFIHGGAGLGKTHLLHAIAHYVHQTNPHAEVRYVSTEAFLNEYVDAIRSNSTSAFKRRFREADVLLVDDIQFMAGKEGLQEEFFHTFNSLHGAGRQIVLSSDRSPRSIATLEDRLRSRFEWGLITDIQPPDLETRLAILQKKTHADRTDAPDDVLDFIARNVTSNIRELEGALIRVTAYANLNNEPLRLELARQVLGDIVDNEPRPITVGGIITATCAFYEFSAEDLCGKQRHRALVSARQIAMFLCRELTDLSYPQIGREFGGRDHTTVMHAVDKITKLIGENRDVYEQVDALRLRLRER